MNQTTNSSFDFNNALNFTMEQIDDLPDYVTPIDGVYKIRMEILQKLRGKDQDKPCIVFDYTLEEIVEMKAGSDQQIPVIGNKMQESFFLENPEGIKFLKRHVKEFWATNPNTPLPDLLKQMDGQTAMLVAKTRKYKDKETQEIKIGWNSAGLVPG